MMNQDVERIVREKHVRFIHLQFTDILGMSKSVAVPAATLPKILTQGLRFDGSAVDAFVRSKEVDMYLHPDPCSFVILPWSDPAEPTARMLCTVKTPDGAPYGGCPRHRLQQISQELTSQGIEPIVSSELEFYLFARDACGLPTTETRDRVSYFDLAPASPGDETRRTVVLFLEDMGVPVEASHHEMSPGQHGIDIGGGDLVTAADRILTAKAVIKRAAILHGLHATFMPRPTDRLGPSALHLSLSTWRKAKNTLHDPRKPGELSDLCHHLTSGILSKASDLALITNPLVNSYKRDTPEIRCSDAGHPVIRIPPERGLATRLELRASDPSSNPYLLLLGIAASCLWGIRTGYGHFNEESFPEDMGEAIALFEESTFAREILGEPLYGNYLSAKRVEWRIFRSSVHQWEVQQYIDKY